MVNNSTPNSKLDETIKESLNNYEARYDAGDWSRMEKMLDAVPKTVTGNMSYGKIAIVAGALILGTFLIYKVASTSSSPESKTEEIGDEPTETTTEPAVVNSTPSSTNSSVVSTPPATTTTPVISEPTPEATMAAGKPELKTVMPGTEKSTKDKLATKKEVDSEYNKHQKVSVMGNEPVFGDMIDSSKGIIYKTQENENTKKAAKTKGTGVGLNSLFNINLDSIKKYNESVKKDSL